MARLPRVREPKRLFLFVLYVHMGVFVSNYFRTVAGVCSFSKKKNWLDIFVFLHGFSLGKWTTLFIGDFCFGIIVLVVLFLFIYFFKSFGVIRLSRVRAEPKRLFVFVFMHFFPLHFQDGFYYVGL